MSTAPKPAPDWFDIYWAENAHKLPILLRGESSKRVAREIVGALMDRVQSQATTTDGTRIIIAFARVVSILKGAQGVLDSPDPSPDQVADAVQRLVDRAKP